MTNLATHDYPDQEPETAKDNEFVPDVTLLEGDCLALMNELPSHSIDLVLADLPYGVTSNFCDTPIDLEVLWTHFRRILTPTGAIVAFAAQPFTTDLINAGRGWFKYDLKWEKVRATGFVHAANKPLRSHEDILVFTPGTTQHASISMRRMTYNPQGLQEAPQEKVHSRRSLGYLGRKGLGDTRDRKSEIWSNYPRSNLRFAKDREHLHPFQKPVALLDYLVRTYSNPGDIVLDPAMGSGSAAVAATRAGRHFIGIERDSKFFDIASDRIGA